MVNATLDGKINLLEFRVEKEYVKIQDPLFVIIPNDANGDENQTVIARAKIDQRAIGKIEKGNQVKIELQSYPAKEYGVINALLDKVSLVPETDSDGNTYYTTDIALNTPLSTTYDILIPYKPNQTGIAKIITEDKNIATRIFEEFIDLIKN